MPLWTDIRSMTQLRDSNDVLDDTSHTPTRCDEEVNTGGGMFMLGQSINMSTKLYHPSPADIRWLWQVFQDNVDPLTKVIHIPTVRQIFGKTLIKSGAVPNGNEALAFTIYAAAVMSLDDEACEERFQEDRKPVLDKLISATELALSKAGSMSTNSLVVLQALVLHLITIRDRREPRVVWTLTGVAVRLA
jgi:hypothetical protein